MDKNKAIERARKLMAMAADSSSPNEAAIAARRARSIMDKFQLEADDLKDAPDFGSSLAGAARHRIPQWEKNIAISIAQLNDCIAHIERGKFVFSGFAEDAEVASFMFLYITENGIRTCKRFISETPSGCRNSFKINYAWAIQSKISEMLQARKTELKNSCGKSLVVIKNQLVEQHFGAAKYGESKAKYDIDPISAIMGMKAGQQTNIVTGIYDETEKPLAILGDYQDASA